jgi:predicted metal-dependent phosphoesterase TrpH
MDHVTPSGASRALAMRFDLHCHSTRSDGIDPPERVVAAAGERACEVFALTDHDTCTHGTGFAPGIRVLHGVEISCDDLDSGRTIHVLAYQRDGAATAGWHALEARLVTLGEARRNRLRVMAARLAQRGIRVDVEPLIADAAKTGRSVGRPDLARAMVACGAATSLKDAFSRHLYDGGPVDVPHHALSIADALALGRDANAAMALAHPHLYDALGVALLRRHRSEGLTGVEAFYAHYDEPERQRWLDLADELGLVCTAGSDSHDLTTAPLGVDVTGDRATQLCAWLAA